MVGVRASRVIMQLPSSQPMTCASSWRGGGHVMCSDSASCRVGHIDRSCGGPSAEMSFFRKPTVMNSDQGTGTGSGGSDEHDRRQRVTTTSGWTTMWL